MWFECEQPFLSGERCVTSRKTAAKETKLNSTSVTFISVLKGCYVYGIVSLKFQPVPC